MLLDSPARTQVERDCSQCHVYRQEAIVQPGPGQKRVGLQVGNQLLKIHLDVPKKIVPKSKKKP